ncbi:cytochrome b561 and DOMON domain-containing protein At4g12980 [Selaginella moellendorffii]|nr:cytochrome b561 and DOMON domain-containing protein At4g12980 [Selaginella moellendorffii]|eukprot:XP_002964568.2 cytochrome b561 and DOMON domain-containing protein At4g12980 [Selaginella moellendorffii]
MEEVDRILLVFFLIVFPVAVAAVAGDPCSALKNFEVCHGLDERVTIAWTLHGDDDPSRKSVLEVAVTGALPARTGWLGWGINPHSLEMSGTSALIAFQSSQGAQLHSYSVSRQVKDDDISLSPQEQTEVPFQNQSVTMEGTVVTIFATIPLTNSSSTTMNHVWNFGDQVLGDSPQSHDFKKANLVSLRRIDMSKKDSVAQPLVSKLTPRQRLKNTHALLSGAAWGIAIPVGVMAARYLRPFTSPSGAWFYLHLMIQIPAYGVGVAGWVLGLKLESGSGNVYETHRNIGYAIFAGGTLQVIALLVRPKPYEKIRFLWNIYHQSIGYTTLVLGVVNVFIGLSILEPAAKFKTAFIAVVISLGAVSLVMEVVTWIIYFQRKYLVRRAAAERRARAKAAQASNARARTRRFWRF